MLKHVPTCAKVEDLRKKKTKTVLTRKEKSVELATDIVVELEKRRAQDEQAQAWKIKYLQKIVRLDTPRNQTCDKERMSINLVCEWDFIEANFSFFYT